MRVQLIEYYGRLKNGGVGRFHFVGESGEGEVHGIYPFKWRAAPQGAITGNFWSGNLILQAACNGKFSKDYIENNFSASVDFSF